MHFKDYCNPKAYGLWNPRNNEISISRDVKFEEDVFPMKIQSQKLLSQTRITTEDEKKSIMLNNIDGLIYKDESDQEDVINTRKYLEEEEQIKKRFAENEGENKTKSNEYELAESSNTRRTKFVRNVKNRRWMADYVVNDKDPVYECNQVTAVQVTENEMTETQKGHFNR
ncbi:hypothetical protein JTB14_033193 [Gonioctena quinquepunctata]|nr:hypothetical protein JTB14_033193 [Gonioctena quinquepunctata]